MCNIRWTIFNTNKNGIISLKKSIDSFLKIYGEKFNLNICFNNIKIEKILKYIKNKKINFIEQQSFFFKNEHGTFWKYCPPRIDINQPELFVDNDVIFIKNNKKITSFLEGNKFLICEDEICYFGKYEKFFNKNEMYNAGIFGIPSGFDFAKQIKETWENYGSFDNLESEDEQGLTALILKKQKPIIILNKKEYVIVHNMGIPSGNKKNLSWRDFDWQGDILHFSGINRLVYHKYWQEYLLRML